MIASAAGRSLDSRFSSRSNKRLNTCNDKLQHLFREVVKTYDCTILVGHRGEEDQNAAFRDGRSTLQWPNGNHNKLPSDAADVAPYPVVWNDAKRFYHFAGYVLAKAEELGYKLRWGGDWDSDLDLNDQNFMDLVHFEIKDE